MISRNIKWVAILAALSSSVAWAQEAPSTPTAPPAPNSETTVPAPAPMPTASKGSLFKMAAAEPASNLEPGKSGATAALSAVSYMAVPAQDPHKYKKHDLVTVVISETSNAATTSQNNSEKKQDFNLDLQQFLALNAFGNGVQQIGSVANPSKLPQIQFNYDNKRQNQADQERQDTFSARITAEVVDVKPNGTLVIEATKDIRTDKEHQIFRLSGICRAEDIAADNTLLSTQLANLKVAKDTTGDVRNGVKPGWLNKALDVVNPF